MKDDERDPPGYLWEQVEACLNRSPPAKSGKDLDFYTDFASSLPQFRMNQLKESVTFRNRSAMFMIFHVSSEACKILQAVTAH